MIALAVEYSVYTTLSSGLNTVQLPESNAQLIGVFHNAQYIQIQLSPGKNAVLFSNTNSAAVLNRIMFKVNYKFGTNQVYITSPSGSVDCVLYFGSPLSGAKSLESYAGVFASATPTAVGSSTVTVTMPSSSGKIIGFIGYVSAGNCQFQWNTSVGKSLTFFDVTNELDTSQLVSPLDIPSVNSFTVTYTNSAAATVYVVFYYQ